FGFGLSYTDFEIDCSDIVKNDTAVTVKADVKNVGKVYGEEVVQVYVSSDNNAVDRPVKLLKGYKRIGVKPNSAETAVIEIDLEDIKFFNPETKSFELDGSYTILIGNSSRNVKEAGKIQF
ncbi:MAG: fibronectin type III-like domain-contianing protein, partial [Clostridia bacterium]|nr:fibronectin type III-like domain-contianing protein [Clostridia bacterium]